MCLSMFWQVPSVETPTVNQDKPVIYKVKLAIPPSLYKKYERYNGVYGGQCVEWLQAIFNSYKTHPEFRGRAGDIPPNTKQPTVGAVVITSEGSVGHVALIIEIDDEELVLAESNISGDEIVRIGRRIRKDSEYIVGYFNF